MIEDAEEVASELRHLLEQAIQKNPVDSILFSGGVDTSIVAAVAADYFPMKAFTCAFQGAPAPDIKYAKTMANKLNLRHYIHYFTEEELHEILPEVIKLLKTFDPMEVRNSIPAMVGLTFAKDNGATSIMTGDAADELFAGYHLFLKMDREKIIEELKKMWNVMTFSSISLGESLGLTVKAPFLDPDFKSFAMNLDPKYKVHKERGQIWGKWILRKAYQDVLPEEVAWRDKNPIEVGSGTTILPKFFERNISDSEFKKKKNRYRESDQVVIRDKEHLVYYEVYRSVCGVPHPTDPEGRVCPQCNSNVPENTNVCRTCGAYPITPEGTSVTAESAYSSYEKNEN
ncbi:MAG: asparagine synthase-related protein [Thermoproteota archaeon]